MLTTRIFITGVTGFIGSYLAPALLEKGYEVGALYRNRLPAHSATSWATRVVWMRDDEVQAQLQIFRPDIVIHLATEYGLQDVELTKIVDANIRLPLNILEAAAAAGCSVFINTDSFFGKPRYCYTHMLAYIQSKNQFLWWARRYFEKQPGYRFINMRLEHVYGARDGPHKFTTYLFNALKNDTSIPLTNGQQRRDFIYVEDVVAAYIHVVQHRAMLPIGFTELEVGNGEAVALEFFIRTAKAIIGSNSKLNFGELPQRDNEIMSSSADTTRINQLGWIPTINLEKGIKLSAGILEI